MTMNKSVSNPPVERARKPRGPGRGGRWAVLLGSLFACVLAGAPPAFAHTVAQCVENMAPSCGDPKLGPVSKTCMDAVKAECKSHTHGTGRPVGELDRPGTIKDRGSAVGAPIPMRLKANIKPPVCASGFKPGKRDSSGGYTCTSARLVCDQKVWGPHASDGDLKLQKGRAVYTCHPPVP